jgi:hypothetical protein
LDVFITLLIFSGFPFGMPFIHDNRCLAYVLQLGRICFRAPRRRGLQIDIHSTYTKHMKKITIVAAVAAVLALAPLMVGCSEETETVNPDEDEAQQPIPGEGGGEDAGGEVEEGSGDGTEDGA